MVIQTLSETGLRLRLLLVLSGRKPGDIAREVGIAPETLSRIVAGKQRCSEATLARIEKAVRQTADAVR